MHFKTLGTFLVFTKMFTFWVVLWLEEVGMEYWEWEWGLIFSGTSTRTIPKKENSWDRDKTGTI